MKRIWLLVALVLILVLSAYYFVFREQGPAAELTTESPVPAAPNQAPPASVPASPASDLPDLTITKLDNSQLRVKELKGKNVLILFQPDCDHCQRETQEIKAHLPAFKDYTLYFVSNYPAELLRKFSQDYGLAFEPNVVFATTTIEAILNTLGPQPSPSVYIYNEQGQLVQKFLGETKVEHILAAL
jgi:peroxiredoxin